MRAQSILKILDFHKSGNIFGKVLHPLGFSIRNKPMGCLAPLGTVVLFLVLLSMLVAI